MPLPNLPFVVIDQNVMRKRDVIEALFAEHDRTGVKLLLSHSAHEEMSQGTADGMRASLATLAKRPDTLLVAHHSVMIFHKHESRYRTPAGMAIVNQRATEDFRTFCRAWNEGEYDDADFDRAFDIEKERVRKALSQRGNDVIYRTVPLSSFSHRTKEEAKNVKTMLQRRADDRTPFREALLESLNIANLHEIMLGQHHRYRTAEKLLSFPSITALRLMAMLTVAYRLHCFGGIETSKKSSDNEDADTENITIAAYGRGLISDDGHAKSHVDDLRYFVSQLWP